MDDINKFKKSIKEWAEDDRPREKLLNKGAASLSNAELIAILIGSGNSNESAVDLSKRILHDVGQNFSKLARLNLIELQQYKGIGEAKAIAIAAAMELGRRRSIEPLLEEQQIKDSNSAFQILSSYLSDLNYESFCLLLLNRSNKLIKVMQVSEGGITGTVVDQRKIFKLALEHNATGIIVGHNHPSGQLTPSSADIELTRKLSESGKILDIPILDHIIVGNSKYLSFADEGMMNF